MPVEDHDAGIRLAGIVDLMMADDRRSWQLQPDATWIRTEVINGQPGTIDTFEVLKEDALARGEVLHVAAPAGRRRRLAGSAGMTDTFEPVAAPAPVEVELKYRVTDVAAAEHYLTAPAGRGRSMPTSRPRRAGSRTATSTRTTARWPWPATRSGSATSKSGHDGLGQVARPQRRARAGPSAARSSKGRPIRPTVRPTGRRRRHDRSSWNMPARPRSWSGSRSARSAAVARSATPARASN